MSGSDRWDRIELRSAGVTSADTPSWAAPEFNVPTVELVLELVVTCSKPEAFGPVPDRKDGQRKSIWPIIGGVFVGKDIRGIVDALYRVRTDDGVRIIIHNKGLGIPGAGAGGGHTKYRLSPEFTVPEASTTG